MNHADLPSIKDARLPVLYEDAKAALAECYRIDECRDWANKWEALASYAKQAENKELENTAMRIRARAISRCGALLKEFEKSKGGRSSVTSSSKDEVTRDVAAKAAGLSKKQAQLALRVNDVEERDPESFEAQVESEKPPTITALAEQGKKPGVPIYERLGITKEAFQAGMYVRGEIESYVKFIAKYSPQDVVEGWTPEDREAMRGQIAIIDQYHDKLIAKL